MSDPRCVLCGASDAKLWTLDSSRQAAVVYLCKTDAAPLQFIMDAAGDLPPSMQVPLTERKEAVPQPVHNRGRRTKRLTPLLDWTPPS
jgi:hypothetical protein